MHSALDSVVWIVEANEDAVLVKSNLRDAGREEKEGAYGGINTFRIPTKSESSTSREIMSLMCAASLLSFCSSSASPYCEAKLILPAGGLSGDPLSSACILEDC